MGIHRWPVVSLTNAKNVSIWLRHHIWAGQRSLLWKSWWKYFKIRESELHTNLNCKGSILNFQAAYISPDFFWNMKSIMRHQLREIGSSEQTPGFEASVICYPIALESYIFTAKYQCFRVASMSESLVAKNQALFIYVTLSENIIRNEVEQMTNTPEFLHQVYGGLVRVWLYYMEMLSV